MPMIRGKAFEFSAKNILQRYLLPNKWLVEKINQNAQSGIHDVDVKVTNITTHNHLSIECKLAGKGSFKIDDTTNNYLLKVKCMRSRTLGTARVAQLAPAMGVTEDQLTVHNDQYRKSDFDIVLTNIANAFYETDSDGNYIWSPTEDGKEFLKNLTGCTTDTELQEVVFNTLYFAKTSDIIITPSNNITCTRRKCTDTKNCQFIPNYPIIIFDKTTFKPINNWYPISDADKIFTPLT